MTIYYLQVDRKAVRFLVNAVRVFRSRRFGNRVRGMKLADGDKVILMTILHGIKASMEEREAYLTIPVERLEIAKGDQEFTAEELGVSLSKEQIIELAKAEEFILTISENGFGKRTSAYHYWITNCGGSGIVNMVLSAKTGDVVASMPANMNDEIMLITNNGKLIRCKLDWLYNREEELLCYPVQKLEGESREVCPNCETSEEEAQSPGR